MTVGDMVGDHGQIWGPWVAPSTAATTPASQAYPATPPPPSASPPMPNVQVIAGADLPRGASTRSHSVCELSIALTQDKFFQQQKSSHKSSLNVKVIGGELLAGDNLQLSSWLPLLPLATDVHTETATLTYAQNYLDGSPQGRDRSGRALRLTLTRALKAGETLPLWFSSEVASQLGLPFLNFSHIRDGAYVCPKCNTKFTAPNPLKLHLATRCETLPSHMLWNRLLDAPPQPTSTPWFTPLLQTSTINSFAMNLKRPQGISPLPLLPKTVTESSRENPPRSPKVQKQVSPDSTSSPVSSPKPNSPPPAPIPEEPKSAFRRVSSQSSSKLEPMPRYQVLPHHSAIFSPGPSQGLYRASARPLLAKAPSTTNSSEVVVSPRLLFGSLLPCSTQPMGNTQTIMPVMPLTGNARPLLTSSASTPPVDPCAEMETLVSNLGRSRRGHLCLYCGKIYSRKYGLKIHIRTHTGYKPLKCKVCLRPFGDPSNLNKHVRLHAEGDTPYRCDHCGKVLVRRRDLDRHIRSRHPELPLANTSSLTDTDEDAEQDGGGDDDDDSEILEVGDNDTHMVSDL